MLTPESAVRYAEAIAAHNAAVDARLAHQSWWAAPTSPRDVLTLCATKRNAWRLTPTPERAS